MKDNSNKVTYSGSSFTTLLQITFIILKLCKVIDWSWWWVLSPMWITTGLVLVIMAIMFLIFFIKNL